MSGMLLDSSLGLEEISQRVLKILAAEINDEIDVQMAAADSRDQELAEILQRPYHGTTVLERIEPENMHLGHRMSVVEAPMEGFPNLCVMAWKADPLAQMGLDQVDFYNDQVYVEVLVKADDEDTVNKRAHRTAEAVHAVINRHRNLDGLVLDISDTPSVLVSDLFPRREKAGSGATWWMQGARLEYAVTKPTPFA
jgi:hypothetical protein